MSATIRSTMNLKQNNEIKRPTIIAKRSASLIKEERRRTGRYIAILVGIMLFILALYHAWVRRIPVVASLVVPALIMFLYVAWVLYTASRDKHRLLDMEAALAARNESHEFHTSDCQNLDISIISKENSTLNTPEERCWTEISAAYLKGGHREHNGFIMPIILINDEPPEDMDQKWLNIVEKQTNSDKLKGFHSRKKFKRKFCRKRRYAAFKRSYSIG